MRRFTVIPAIALSLMALAGCTSGSVERMGMPQATTPHVTLPVPGTSPDYVAPSEPAAPSGPGSGAEPPDPSDFSARLDMIQKQTFLKLLVVWSRTRGDLKFGSDDQILAEAAHVCRALSDNKPFPDVVAEVAKDAYRGDQAKADFFTREAVSMTCFEQRSKLPS